MTRERGRDDEAFGIAEEIAARLRVASRRLLVAGIVLAVVILGLGILVVYGLGLTPGMPTPGG